MAEERSRLYDLAAEKSPLNLGDEELPSPPLLTIELLKGLERDMSARWDAVRGCAGPDIHRPTGHP